MTKRKAPPRVARKKSSTTKHKTAPKSKNNKTKNDSVYAQRNDPKYRGIHEDAIQVGIAPTSAASCVACDTKIPQGHARWGMKYAGNPLPTRVLPLYGSHPMVLWCHAGTCGLAFERYSNLDDAPPAARTCHACQDAPNEPGDHRIRLLCGGTPKLQKIRHHTFHISCWIRSIQKTGDPLLPPQLLVKPEDIGNTKGRGLSWKDLTSSERKLVREEFQRMGVS